MAGFDDPAFFGERWADVYDEGPDPEPVAEVEFLAGLAGGGRVLELAIGTGRVGLPLGSRGITVEGLEGSEKMVARLRAKPGGEQIPVTVGDSADRQAACFRNVAHVLDADGAFVIECFVPDPAKFDRDQRVDARAVTEDSATIEVWRHDAAAQRFKTQKITFSSQGIRMLPVALRYCWPSELDLMAAQAGLRLSERYAGWDRRPYGSDSTSHVSVYRPG